MVSDTELHGKLEATRSVLKALQRSARTALAFTTDLEQCLAEYEAQRTAEEAQRNGYEDARRIAEPV